MAFLIQSSILEKKMEPYSRRFQSSRSRLSLQPNDVNTSSKKKVVVNKPSLNSLTTLQELECKTKSPLQNQNKQNFRITEPRSTLLHCLVWFFYSLVGQLCLFYAHSVTCFRFITACVCGIICQNQELTEPKKAAGNHEHNKNICSNIPEFDNQLSPNKSAPPTLFSSDSEEDTYNCFGLDFDHGLIKRKQYNSKQPGGECVIEEVLIDDYELPLVRFIDNFIYLATLYFCNYPAYRLERDRGCNLLSYRGPFNHNVNPKEKRPSIVNKGIKFLKKRKIAKKMSRVYGDTHKRWILRISLASRLLIFVLQLMAFNLPQIFKHDNDGFKFTPEESYGKLLDRLVNSTFGGYINWDAHYFLHISVYGYTSENMLAFFPLLPMLLYIPSRITYMLLSSIISLSSIVTILGVVLNIWLFLKCTENIYELSKCLSNGTSRKLITTSCMLFCFNPASIFFGGLYTETLFAYLSSSVLLFALRRQIWISLICAALSCLCRSNGVLNVGFVIFLELQNELRNSRKLKDYVTFSLQCVGNICFTAAPFILFQMYGISNFCKSGNIYDDMSEIPLYCMKNRLVLPYSYIQNKYWNVGFLQYFRFKQIPNFILAVPVLYVLGRLSLTTLKSSVSQMQRNMKLHRIDHLFYALHGLFFTFFCLLFVHVQVSTRMIMAACPYLYVHLAASYKVEVEKFRSGEIDIPYRSIGVIVWCIFYYVIGTLAFSLGLPWT